MLRYNGYIVCCSLAILAFACVATPRQAQDIENARASIRQVASLPLAQEVAAQEIAEARAALRYAETLAKRHGSGSEISIAAHMAERHADLAGQQIELEQTKRLIDSAEKEWQARENLERESAEGAVAEDQDAEFATLASGRYAADRT